MRWLDCIANAMDLSLSKLQEMVKGRLACCSSWGRREVDTAWQLNIKPRQHIKKQRHYFANKGPSSQSYFEPLVFPVDMYRCESWTIKKAEH